jgi:hypothetical protein
MSTHPPLPLLVPTVARCPVRGAVRGTAARSARGHMTSAFDSVDFGVIGHATKFGVFGRDWSTPSHRQAPLAFYTLVIQIDQTIVIASQPNSRTLPYEQSSTKLRRWMWQVRFRRSLQLVKYGPPRCVASPRHFIN